MRFVSSAVIHTIQGLDISLFLIEPRGILYSDVLCGCVNYTDTLIHIQFFIQNVN